MSHSSFVYFARPARTSVFLILPLLFATQIFTLGAAAEEPRVTPDLLTRIQKECLRAYPPEMRVKMTSGKGAKGTQEIPAEVDTNPKEQMHFLNKELEVEKGLFYPSLLEELVPAFEPYLGEGKRFLDLGSGDGRVVFLAAALGSHATGMEYDPKLIEISEQVRGALGDVVDPKRVSFIEGDFFAQSWSGYDVIFYFDLSSVEPERVRRKLQEEMDLGARLVVGYENIPFEGFLLETQYDDMKIFRLSSRARPARAVQ